MERCDIEIFNAIVDMKNLSKAADALYMSPTTLGARLKALEEELGVELVERKKGAKTVALTDAGKAFSHIAEQMITLYKECATLSVRSSEIRLCIGSADAFLKYNFIPLYQSLICSKPSFQLDLKLYPSDMIYPLISRQEIDIGFALYDVKFPDIQVEKLFSDDVVVIIPPSFPWDSPSIRPVDLDPSLELLIASKNNHNVGWGNIFNVWHSQTFDTSVEPQLRVNSVSIIDHFLQSEFPFWTLLPRIIAMGVAKRYPVRILELESDAPLRTCYMLTHKRTALATKKNIEHFKEHLDRYIETNIRPFCKA